MIRRRFLALAFAAIVSMHVPQLRWFEGEENNPELEGTIEWDDQGDRIGCVLFEVPGGCSVVDVAWEWEAPEFGWGSLPHLTTMRVSPGTRRLSVPVYPARGRVHYRWRTS